MKLRPRAGKQAFAWGEKSVFLLCILLLLALIRGIGYAILTPPWQAPDETGHFEYAWLIANLGRLPQPEDTDQAFEKELLSSLYEWQYGEFIKRPLPDQMPSEMEDLPQAVFAVRSRTVLSPRFSLSYLWQALFLYPFRYQDLTFQLYVARFSSVLLNVGIIWIAWHIFRSLLPHYPVMGALMTAVLVFWPQHTFINSMVGEGALAELMATVVLYGWIHLFLGQGSYRVALYVVLGTLFGIWSKNTAAFLIPLNLTLSFWWIWRHFSHRQRRVHWLYLVLSILVLGLGIWFWSQSFLGKGVMAKVLTFFEGSDVLWVDKRGITFGEALLFTHDSFWATFGWMTLGVSERWYGALLLLTLLALLGWVQHFRSEHSRSEEAKIRWGTILTVSFEVFAWAVFIWAALLSKSDSGHYQFQGRYLFPIAVPHVFLVVKGLDHLFSNPSKSLVFHLLLILLVGFDAWCIVGYVWPYYYGV